MTATTTMPDRNPAADERGVPPRRATPLALLTWLMAAELTAQGAVPPPRPVVEHPDLRYSEAARSAESNRLDLYVPGDATPARVAVPVVVFAHGGSWMAGDKSHYAELGRYLARNGLACAQINYRLHPFSRWPACVEDCARACVWLRDNGRDLGVDGERLLLAGHSAGAHVAGIVANDPRWLRGAGGGDLRPLGFAGISGVYDVRPDIQLFNAVFGRSVDVRAAASPIVHAGRDSPPSLVVWGEHDLRGLALSGRMLAARLELAGVQVDAHEYPGQTHLSSVRRIGGADNVLGPGLVQFLRARAGAPGGRTRPAGNPPAEEPAAAPVTCRSHSFDADRRLSLHRPGSSLDLPVPLLVFAHADDQPADTVERAARTWAGRGVAVAVVDCEDAPGDAAVVATGCAWLIRHAAGLGLDGNRVFLAAAGRAAAPALLAAFEPRWFDAQGLGRDALRGVVTIAAPGTAGADGNPEDWLRAGLLPVLPIVGAEAAGSARALTQALVGAGNIAIPVPGLDAANCLRDVGTAADVVSALVLGFVAD